MCDDVMRDFTQLVVIFCDKKKMALVYKVNNAPKALKFLYHLCQMKPKKVASEIRDSQDDPKKFLFTPTLIMNFVFRNNILFSFN